MNEATPAWPAAPLPFAGSDWLDPLEDAVRSQVRALRAPPRPPAAPTGHHVRPADALGARARLHDEAGEQEWKSAFLPAYKRLSRRAEALIAEAYLAGMSTRRVRRALAKPVRGPRRQGRGQPRLAANALGLGSLAAA